jgi:hypothetical protein
MKNTLLLLLLLLISSLSVYPEPVDTNTARKVAKNFITHQNSGNPTIQSQEPYLACTYTTKEKGLVSKPGEMPIPLFYIYNIRGGQGFVIVSADDAAIPVLGYSNEGSFTGNNMPVAFDKLLEKFRQEIKFIKLNSLQADDNINMLWQENITANYVSTFSTNAVSPLVATKWNQAPYYNDLCPYDATHNERTVTGCVATAMAQIMKYWNYPATGTGFSSYNHSTYGTLSANFGSTTYNWAGMPNSVNSTNNAVATLMYHVGVSVDMDYGPGSTGGSSAYVISSASATQACSEYALKTYFGYDASLQGIQRTNFTDAVWIQKLKTELDAGRPILYTGFGQGGHAFVCDGYDNSNNFHFNWGWGGMYDGYFNINSLNPGTGGAGSGAGTYNNGQQALMGIKPISGGTGTSDIELNSVITVSPNPIEFGVEYIVNADVINKGNTNFSGDYCAALFDPSNNFVDFIQILSTGSNPLPPGYHYTSGIDFADTIRTVPGTYSIGIFYRPTGGDWKLASSSTYQSFVSININGPVNTIKLYSSIQPSPATFVQGKPATVSAKLLNSGTATYYGQYQAALIDLTGKFIIETIDLYDETTGLPSGYAYSSPLTFSTTAITSKPGTYMLAILEKETGYNYWWYAGANTYTNPVFINVIEPSLTPDAYETNNTEVTAYNLPVSFSGNTAHVTSAGSNLHIGTDVDYYSLSLPAGFNYTITARVHDSYKSGDGNTYTADVVFAYNDGSKWSDSYDDVMGSNIIMNNGGTLKFNVVPRYSGNTGTYLLDISISKASTGQITVTSPVTGNSWEKTVPQTITWTDNIADNVKIELYKGINNVLSINSSAPSNGSYGWTPPSTLVADAYYRIKVTSTADNAVYDYSDYFSIIEKTVSIADGEAKQESVSFYPNPVNSILNFYVPDNDLTFNHVRIANSIGETVLDKTIAAGSKFNRLDVSALTGGIYYLTLSGDQKTVNYRFSIVK